MIDTTLAIKTGIREGYSVNQFLFCFAPSYIKPLFNVLVVFGTIATEASRRDITRCCSPTFRNGKYVIPSRGRSVTVGTQTFEVSQYVLLSFRRNGSNAPLSGMNKLSNPRPELLVGGVLVTNVGPNVFFASALLYIRFPVLTITAPVEAKNPHRFTQWQRRPWPLSRQAAIDALCRKSIPTGSIGDEIPALFPRPANVAVLQSDTQVEEILFN